MIYKKREKVLVLYAFLSVGDMGEDVGEDKDEDEDEDEDEDGDVGGRGFGKGFWGMGGRGRREKDGEEGWWERWIEGTLSFTPPFPFT